MTRAARPIPGRGNRGVTFLEVVFGSVILAIVAASLASAFSLIENLTRRDEMRLAAYEVAHRIILQYMDDPGQLPPEHLPLEMGPYTFRYIVGQEILLEDAASGEGTDIRRGANTEQLTPEQRLSGRLTQINVRVFGPGQPHGQPIAALSRVFDPLSLAESDPNAFMIHMREAFKDEPEMQILIDTIIAQQRQQAQNEAFERGLRSGSGNRGN